MFRLILKLFLVLALLAMFAVTSVPAFAGGKTCSCFSSKCAPFGKGGCGEGGCSFDNKTSQCVNVSCSGICQSF